MCIQSILALRPLEMPLLSLSMLVLSRARKELSCEMSVLRTQERYGLNASHKQCAIIKSILHQQQYCIESIIRQHCACIRCIIHQL